jgi:four helix bundle protein
MTGKTIAQQMIRSGTSVAANYRATRRARSNAEFISKMHIVLEESDETQFWLEMIVESGLIEEKKIKNLQEEANELTSIFVKTLKSVKSNKKKK